MKNVIVTGGTGFIGAPLTQELLQRGYHVHQIVHGTLPQKTENVTFHRLDLMDGAAFDRFLDKYPIENMIHLAWYVGPKCHVSNLNMDWIIATLNMLRSFKEHGGRRFVGAGTVSEYEYKYGYLHEDDTPTNPGTLYGNGKNAIYNIARVYSAQNGIDFKWPRIFNLYGPGEKTARLMPSVINSCLSGNDVRVSDCLKFQDYLHVSDTARGIVDVFESELTGAVNICSGVPVQLRTIVEKIAKFTNFQGRILWGALPAAFGDDLVVGNNEKLKSIGWTPQYDLDSGLKQTINWWKEVQNVR